MLFLRRPRLLGIFVDCIELFTSIMIRLILLLENLPILLNFEIFLFADLSIVVVTAVWLSNIMLP